MLKTIERWRQRLAENIASRNELSEPARYDAAQAAIERLLLLKLCADLRGPNITGVVRPSRLRFLAGETPAPRFAKAGETPAPRFAKAGETPAPLELLESLGNEADGETTTAQLSSMEGAREVHRRLGHLFHCMCHRYGLGQVQYFGLLPAGLKIDDDPLREICAELFDRGAQGEFSDLPPEILGQVYEQYLAKAVHRADGAGADGKKKLAARRASGAYYTPRRVADYVVEHTVGNLLRGKTPPETATLAIVDPACGGGAFLLGAYRHLLDRRRDFYLADGAAKHADKIVQDRRGAWRLRGGEKMRILRNNIFGVDIDPRAVEVTRLSLAFLALAGDARETPRADLAANIRCGNAVIGPDYHRDRPQPAADRDWERRVRAFDWEAAFPAVAAAGGFDAVVGNPPWGQKAIDDDASMKRYVRQRYPSAAGIYDLFRPFVERGIQLLRPGGRFGMVLPDIVLLKNYEATRRYLLEQMSLDRIDWWGGAFDGAVIDAATIVGVKVSADVGHLVAASVREAGRSFSRMIPQREFWSNPRLTFNLLMTPEKRRVLARVRENPCLGDAFEVHEGVHSGNIRGELFVADKIDDTCRELYFGRGEIAPHRIQWHGKYIRLAAAPSPKTRARYANLGKPAWHERAKVLVRRTGDRVLAAVDAAGRYASNNFFLVFPKAACGLDLYGLAALLNSRFITWYFRAIEPRRGRVFAELKIKHLATFPIPANPALCRELNAAGIERAQLADEAACAATCAARDDCLAAARDLDSRIEELTRQAYDLPRILA